jgi:DNA-binding response OmpR family regulator
MRKHENVIIISAKDSVDDKIEGLETGADDYLAKPFHLSELNARIKSIIRRNRAQGDTFIELGNLRLHPDTFEVYAGNHPLELNRKEYDILHYFIVRPNRLVEKTTLAEAVWGDHIDQADNYDFIYAQIKNLRRKMNDAGATAEIKAVYGFGYKITATP